MFTYFEDAFTQEEFEAAVWTFLTRAVAMTPDGIPQLKARALVEGIMIAVEPVKVAEMRSLGPVQDLLKAGWGNGPKASCEGGLGLPAR